MTSESTIFSFSQITDQPTRRSYRAAIAVIFIYMAITLSAIPFGATKIAEIPALTAIFGAIVVTTDLSSGFLLLVMFREMRSVSLLILACFYLYTASMALLNLLTFPGVLVRDAIAIGSAQSSAWAFLLWMIGSAILGLAAMGTECMPLQPIHRDNISRFISFGLWLTLLVFGGIALITTRFIDLLPPLIQGAAFLSLVVVPREASIVLMLLTVLLGLVKAGRRSNLFLWATAAFSATLCVNVLTLTSGGRDTLGWSLGRASWMLSACVLFLFFIRQFANQLPLLAKRKDALEYRVQERTIDLTRTLRQRDALLREVYHRVGNNLQIVDSILFLERRRIDNPAMKDVIDLLRGRIFALGLAHRQLMSSENMEHFDIAPFLRELIQTSINSDAVKKQAIKLRVEAESMMVNLDIALPLGLLATELITSSMKSSNAQNVSVSFLCSDGDSATLVIKDDCTYNETRDLMSATRILPKEQENLIVAALINQLDARLNVTWDTGRRVEIVFPLPEGARNEG